MIVATHARYHSNLYAVPFIRNSYLFVDFFFVLSGFVITHAYGQSINGQSGLQQFIIRRIGRLWPLNITVLAAFIAVEFARASYLEHAAWLLGGRILSTIAEVFLLQSAVPVSQIWNAPDWSISSEFVVYLIFAGYCLVALRSVWWAIALSAMGLLGVLVLSPNGMEAILIPGTFRCLYGFFIGHCIYRLWKMRRPAQSPISNLQSPISNLELPMLLLVVGFVSIAHFSVLTFAAPLVFGLVVYIFASEAGLVSRILKSQPFVHFGLCSYSIYMLHVFVLTVIDYAASVIERGFGTQLHVVVWIEGAQRKVLFLGPEWARDVMPFLYSAIVVALATLTYRYIEAPARSWFKQISSISHSTLAAK